MSITRTTTTRGNPKEQKRTDFDNMVGFVKRHFPDGFAKPGSVSAVPRVRFEAISVGVHLALNLQPRLAPKNVEWLTSAEFKLLTTTHASNSGPRLKARIEFVRDRLLET